MTLQTNIHRLKSVYTHSYTTHTHTERIRERGRAVEGEREGGERGIDRKQMKGRKGRRVKMEREQKRGGSEMEVERMRDSGGTPGDQTASAPFMWPFYVSAFLRSTSLHPTPNPTSHRRKA